MAIVSISIISLFAPNKSPVSPPIFLLQNTLIKSDISSAANISIITYIKFIFIKKNKVITVMKAARKSSHLPIFPINKFPEPVLLAGFPINAIKTIENLAITGTITITKENEGTIKQKKLYFKSISVIIAKQA